MANKTRISPLAWVFLAIIAVYRRFLSPLMGNQCRFSPTCSHYAAEAIEKHGGLRGGWLAVKRILKCHPYYRGSGLDPVPDKLSRRPRQGDDLSL